MIHYRYRTSLHRALLAGILLAAILTGGVFMPHHTAHAQDTTNLLTNGGLERPYYGQASATQTAPQGWTLWVGGGNPEAFPHNDPVQVLDGSDSWNIHQGYTAFIAAGYQRVGGLSQGDALEFTAYGWAYTCNDTTNSCVIQEAPYRRSDTAAGVSMKVGIDPTGGTDPYAGTVQWSGSAAPYDQWARLSVSAAAQGDTVTVFMFASQQAGLALNNVYWDKASLIRTNGVTVNASGTPVAATAVQQQVVFTSAQPPQTDGSIIHTVQQGDTLSGIAYAYAEYGVTIQSIADLDPVIEPNTRFLTVGQKIMILPPGSVDPETGDLLAPGQTLPTAAPTGADTTPVPAATDPDAQSTRIPTPTPLSAQLPTPTPAPQVTATPTEIRSMGWLRPLPTVPPQPISRAEPVQEVAQAITAAARWRWTWMPQLRKCSKWPPRRPPPPPSRWRPRSPPPRRRRRSRLPPRRTRSCCPRPRRSRSPRHPSTTRPPEPCASRFTKTPTRT
ncbi:MAG TPA: LysM peptidoglycan-binding domain-containing protein [Aggregatilinea sp.]|uniref:LysM peptidoglycan-binding domain-containing protein n=1 Tax=Aggregatilinea sp. TaxID=2806333 RepID=UPI002C70C820|nr:LysM peptidoglycan-binding domain-containing protein [Aggregatilinea sp.]HML22989.1 LysM peptidoglycan-binding domain-containing protein [Aggregatilinea sp.]